MPDNTPDGVIVTPVEDPPRSGEWVDCEQAIFNPTRDELAEGERLGEVIDVDDDHDNGLGS